MTQYIPIYMHSNYETHHKINDMTQQELKPVYKYINNNTNNINEYDIDEIDNINDSNPLKENLKIILIILIMLFIFFMGVSGAIIHYNTKNSKNTTL
jgi:hypothetical protein